MRLVFATILFRSLATVCAKKAAITSQGLGLEGILFNVWTAAELFALMLQAIFWSHALNKFQLNKVYPYLSLVFGLNLAAAWLIFQEAISTNHIAGIVVIAIGIIIINSSEKVSTPLG